MKKKRCVILLFAITSAMLLLQAQPVFSIEGTSAPDEALVFGRDIVQLDLKKYNATMVANSVRYPTHLAGLAEEDVVYLLETDGSKLEWACAFINGSLAHCGLFINEGSPFFMDAQQNGITSKSKDILQKYETYTTSQNIGQPHELDTMKETLDMFEATKSNEITIGNVVLKVATEKNFTSFQWNNIIDGVPFPSITLEFRDGIFCGLGDIWKYYTIGNTNINITKEAAIQIALEHLKNFTWEVGDAEVTEFNVIEEPLTAELFTTKCKEPLTLSPYWRIELPLDKTYPGQVTFISLAIWADTGIIESCIPVGGGGVPYEDNNESALPTQTQADTTPSQVNIDGLIIVVISAAVVISISVLTIKKKHKP
ncbi:MAG: hypothetical protein NWF05_03070 [Candidatus Bathyarchaeota archaeon]|nr:hypothetical protein [Candidatus Bathyarchaeota archaeon]